MGLWRNCVCVFLHHLWNKPPKKSGRKDIGDGTNLWADLSLTLSHIPLVMSLMGGIWNVLLWHIETTPGSKLAHQCGWWTSGNGLSQSCVLLPTLCSWVLGGRVVPCCASVVISAAACSLSRCFLEQTCCSEEFRASTDRVALCTVRQTSCYRSERLRDAIKLLFFSFACSGPVGWQTY